MSLYLATDLCKLFDTVVMVTELQFLFCLSDFEKEDSKGEVLRSNRSFLQELNGVLNVFKMPRAADGDQCILHGIQTII